MSFKDVVEILTKNLIEEQGLKFVELMRYDNKLPADRISKFLKMMRIELETKRDLKDVSGN